MNINTERAKFMQAMLQSQAKLTEMMSLPDAEFAIEFGMFIWLAAKDDAKQVHAEEMHKPKCILEKAGDGYAIRLSWRPGDWLKFTSEDDARTWAKANGYRVIE